MIPKVIPRLNLSAVSQAANPTSPRSLTTTTKRSFNVIAQKTNLKANQPGHVSFGMNVADMTKVQPHLPSELQRRLADAESKARWPVGTIEVGHDSASGINAHKDNAGFKNMVSRDGVAYTDYDLPAAPVFTNTQKNNPHASETVLGNLTPGQARIVAQQIAQKSDRWALSGQKEEAWIPEEGCEDLVTEDGAIGHLQSAWPPNCVDFVVDTMVELAEHELQRGADGATVEAAVASLKAAKRPEDVEAAIVKYFGSDGEGYLALQRPGQAQEPAAPATLQGSRFYGQYLKASGMDEAAFAHLTSQLAQDAPFFSGVFNNDDDKRWGTEFFTALGQRLKDCGENEATASVCYHLDTYPGNVTHISAFAVTPKGDLSISHHEYVETNPGGPVVDNLMTNGLGLPLNTYARSQPVQGSYLRSGPPTVQMTKIEDFAAFKKFNDEMAQRSEGPEGAQWLYAADPARPSHREAEKWAKERGEPYVPDSVALAREKVEPKIPSPGDTPNAAAYTNNCAAMTLRALNQAKCVDIPKTAYTGSAYNLWQVGKQLLNYGLMPDTDPAIFDDMKQTLHRQDKDGKAVYSPVSFLIQANNEGNAPPSKGSYASTVRRNPPKDPAASVKLREKQEAAVARAIEKSRASFEV